MAIIRKGDKGILQYTHTARHRIGAGVSWDAAEKKVDRPKLFQLNKPEFGEAEEDLSEHFENPYGEDIKSEVGEVLETYDIDLVCLMYNEDGELSDAVSPMDGEEIDQSGKIYHSGDERQGISINDDEIISVELKDLPEYIHHMVFLVTAQCGNDLSEIVNPEMRIFDAIDDRNLLHTQMGGASAKGKTAFIFCRIYRGKDDWEVHNISEYRIDAEVENWAEEIKPFLK